MPGDLRTDLMQKKSELEAMLLNAQLTPEIKTMVKTAIEFGYAAAFCERTADINDSYFQSEQFRRQYDEMLKKLNY
jgi:hypothetical protein